MKIKIGDKVRFLNDVGGGKVTTILPDSRVMVLDETGFEIPVYYNEVVVVGSTTTHINQPEITTYNKVKEPDNFENDLLYFPQGTILSGNNKPKALFTIVPQGKSVAKSQTFEAFIVNDSNYHMFCNIYENKGSSKKHIKTGIVAPNRRLAVEVIDRNKLSGSALQLTFHLNFYSKDYLPLVNPWYSKLNIDYDVFTRETIYKNNLNFAKPTAIFQLTDTLQETKNFAESLETLIENNKAKIESDQSSNKQIKKIVQPETLREIDLHIGELLDTQSGLSPKDMLDIQLKHFISELDRAISDRVKRIVFIHGLGNGTLKAEIRKILEREYKRYEYHDASFKEYGYGATMIILTK